jgi:outer membrane protein TolC
MIDSPVFPTPSYFKKHFDTQPARVELRGPVRIDDFVIGDHLELSLRSYLELVMANNTDMQVQRLSIETQRNAITRAFAPFDPSLLATFQSQRTKTQTGDVLSGAEVLSQLSQPARFSYSQRLQTGTLLNVGFFASKTASNSAFASFNPLLNTQLALDFQQPLLRGRGTYVQRLPIMIARSRYRQSEYSMHDQITRLLVQAENAYWQLVLERESLRVQEEALKLNEAFLKRNERELELGAISPLDIFNPQAQYESAKIQVSQARYRVIQAEDALRRQIGADLDPRYQRMPIEPTEPVAAPASITDFDREALVQTALRLRPDLKAQLQALDIDDLQLKSAQNQLRPDLSITGAYTSTGRGGIFYERGNVFTEFGERQSQIIRTVPGGFGDSLNQLFGFGFPVYSFGLRLQLPLRDRAAAANLADATVSKRLDALRARSLEQNIRQEVLNAITQVESSRASIDIAKVQLDLAQKALDAENRKYELGTTTAFFVLDAQQRLVQAQAQLVNQTVTHRRNLLTLLQRTGELPDERGVQIQ